MVATSASRRSIRLRYYASNLNVNYIDPKWKLFLDEAPIKDWKLLVVSSTPRTLR
ncbi:MAG TPA: hypothetical protein VIQ24_17135 [Pyrinomonadaceae bacterium]